MGTVVFRLEGTDAGAVQAFLKLTDAQKQATLEALRLEQATKRAAQSTQEVKKSADDVGTSFLKAGGAFLAGFAGLSSVSAGLSEIIDKMRRIRELQQEKADSARSTQDKILKMAQQRGWTGDEGYRKAVKLAQDIASQGGIDLGTAADIDQAVQGNLTNNIAPAVGIRIARMLSGMAGKSGIQAETAGAITELIDVVGAGKSKESATKFMAQTEQALLASKSLGFGSFSTSTVKGIRALVGRGLTQEQALVLATQARALAGGSDDVAGETLNIVSQSLDHDDLAPILKRYGVDKGQAYEQVQAIGKAIADAKGGDIGAQRLWKEIRPERRQRLESMFAEPAIRARDLAIDMINKTNVDAFEKSLSAHQQSLGAQMRIQDNTIEAEDYIETLHNKDSILRQRWGQKQRSRKPVENEFSTFESFGYGLFTNTVDHLLGGAVKHSVEQGQVELFGTNRDPEGNSLGEHLGQAFGIQAMPDRSKGRGGVPATPGRTGVYHSPNEQKSPASQPVSSTIQYHYGDVYLFGQRDPVAGRHPYEIGIG